MYDIACDFYFIHSFFWDPIFEINTDILAQQAPSGLYMRYI